MSSVASAGRPAKGRLGVFFLLAAFSAARAGR